MSASDLAEFCRLLRDLRRYYELKMDEEKGITLKDGYRILQPLTEAGLAGMPRRDGLVTAHSGPACRARVPSTEQHCNHFKSANDHVHMGPMRIKQSTMSVLLVFAKEDSQSDGFWWAADRGGYKCNLVRNAEGAVECYLDKHHDLVIIDARTTKHFDAESLCRSIRATKSSEHTVIVAVTKKAPSDKEEPPISPLLTAGFNRRFLENHNTGVCFNELLMLEQCEVRLHTQLRATGALLTALENSNDAVEITSDDHEVQYVNPAYERLFGYNCEELVGKDRRSLAQSEKNRPDLQENINTYLKKGKPWEGIYYARRKNGETFSHHCKIAPVHGESGRVHHYVSIRNPTLESSHSLEKFNGDSLTQLPTGLHTYHGRRDSIVRMQTMTIEAPITKVINIINAAQENSPLTVVQALDKVLEILQSTELYSPYYSAQVKDDMTSDLVGGLMTVKEDSTAECRHRKENNTRRFSSSAEMTFSKSASPIVPVGSTQGSVLAQVSPEIQNVLNSESCWDFPILELERISKRRPLVYVGLKTFQRFGVLEYLRVGEKEMEGWLQMIERNYHADNPYHNSTHAADVMHATAYFLCSDKIKNIFDKSDEIASLLAAVVHDLDHPGFTNNFLVNDGSELAVLYNDLAVLESHHVSLAFQMTTKDANINIFKNLDRDTFRNLREQMIDMVLATEMTKHFEHLNKFVSSINQPSLNEDSVHMGSGKNSPDSSCSTTRLAQPENRKLIKRMMIKCADVSNPLRPVDMCIEWAKRIASEYCHQTDEEKRKGLPVVMPIFDSKSCNVPKSQISFIDFFINDMFDAWDVFCDVPELMNHLKKNYNYWKEQEQIVAAEQQKSEGVETAESTAKH